MHPDRSLTLLPFSLGNYPNQGFQRVKMDTKEARLDFRERLRADGMEGLTLRCYLMAAWHTAAPAVEVSARMLCTKRAWLLIKV